MRGVLLRRREFRWVCPNCTQTAVTERVNETKMHHCRGLFGLWAPMLPEGVKAKVTAREREDVVGDELVPLTDVDGRLVPFMAVDVLRDEGNDVVVFAPTARADARAMEVIR